MSAAFDTVYREIPLQRLQSEFGVTDTPLDWLRSYLETRTQFVKLGQHQSPTVGSDVGVPQGSVLGPLLFAIYCSPVADIIASHGVQYHQYADDTQLRLAVHADNTSDGLSVFTVCTTDVKQWYMHNGLQLNPDKSEALIVGTANQLHAVTPAVSSVSVAGVDLPVAEDLNALGVMLDRRPTFQKHVMAVVRVIGIDGYTVYRRDRTGRRGGGVAMYVHSNIQATIWSPTSSVDSRAFELLWVRVGVDLFVAALYHPPRPVYAAADLLSYVENCVAEVSHDYPLAEIILAGDLNHLQDNDVVERTGLTQIVHQPTRGANLLDRVFVSNPQLYSTVRVVSSVVKSDHKAVVATSGGAAAPISKTSRQHTFRPRTPSQNANLLQHLATIDLRSRPDPEELSRTPDPQAVYDSFYAFALALLEEFYPERTITVTSRDPSYITPVIKARLRRKNRLMRARRVDEAGALAR